MKNIRKILVPIDFSDCSHALALQAAQLAAQLGAELVFIHVLTPPAGLSATMKMFPEGYSEPVEMQDYLRAGAEGRMPEYVALVANAEGVASTAHIVVGSPVESILSVAQSLPADMIVMGSHGRTGLNRVLLGSVSERVLRRATMPVVVIRSLHRPECEARSCATCASGVTMEQAQARAEADG